MGREQRLDLLNYERKRQVRAAAPVAGVAERALGICMCPRPPRLRGVLTQARCTSGVSQLAAARRPQNIPQTIPQGQCTRADSFEPAISRMPLTAGMLPSGGVCTRCIFFA